MPLENILNVLRLQYIIPHVEICYFSHKTTILFLRHGLCALILSKHHSTPWLKNVSHIIYLPDTPLSIYPKGCKTKCGFPGHAQMTPKSCEVRECKHHAPSTHVQTKTTTRFTQDSQFIIGRVVGEEYDFAVTQILCGHSHAECEFHQIQRLQWGYDNKARLWFIQKTQCSALQT